MSLRHILLGLIVKPTSGYDLHKEFQTSFAHFWFANLSQIYPTLKQLEVDGLVISKVSASTLGPARCLYSRTRKGEAALVEWLEGGPQILNVRRHYLAQVYFLGALRSAASARDFFGKFLETLRARQASLEAIQKSWRGDRGADFGEQLEDDEFYPYMALELGLEANRTRIEWCRRCLARIDKVRLKGSKKAAARRRKAAKQT
jgi:PadR family transcriptional regulator, regulatory protein AphA